MGIVLKDYTGEQIFEAIKQDGFNIVREAWLEGEGKNIAGCLLGIASLNLGVVPSNDANTPYGSKYGEEGYGSERLEGHSLFEQLNTVRVQGQGRYGSPLGEYIIEQFDDKSEVDEYTLIDAGFLAPNYADFDNADELYVKAEDKFWDSLHPTQVVPKSDEYYYVLSWDAAVEMCREVLTPYFTHVFKVATEDFAEMLNWTPPTFQAA